MGSLQTLLKEMQEIQRYLLSKSHITESLEYKSELEFYDIYLEHLNDIFNAVIAGLHKLPGLV